MALKRECDNPACETSLEVEPDELEDLPAGWWVLERAEAIGEQGTRYAVCSLNCVRTVADLFNDAPEDDEHGPVDS